MIKTEEAMMEFVAPTLRCNAVSQSEEHLTAGSIADFRDILGDKKLVTTNQT